MWTWRPGSISLAGAPDHLPVAQHHFARRDRPQRHFVPGGDRRRSDHADAVHAQLSPGGERHARHRHVVGRMQMDDRILGGGELGDIQQGHAPII